MGTLQTQSSKPVAVADKKILSYDHVSKFFSLPLCDAADALAVCRSDLKKICYENGLVRWPYRKILAGKSVEEIKKDTGRESNKKLAEFLKATREINDASVSSAALLSPGSQIQSKSSSTMIPPEMTSLRGFLKQQQGSKNSSNRIPSDLNGSLPWSLDEFKYGFPSGGLSTASNKWWDGTSVFNDNQQSTEKKISGESSLLGKSVNESLSIGSDGTGLLTAVRKQGFEEGKLLGVYRESGGIAKTKKKKLCRKERILLLGIFKSSLPTECATTWF